MSELNFAVQAVWSGSGPSGEGELRTSGGALPYAAPAEMGGKGVGTSPEELLAAAVATCYSGTLYRVLERQGLPVQRIALRAEAIVEAYPEAARLSRITVHPQIQGGDPLRIAAYREQAMRARDLCFIGKAVRASVAYEVGEVEVQS